MVIAIVLLVILFLIGFLNTLFHIPPNKFLSHLQSLLHYNNSSSSSSSPPPPMTTKPIQTPKLKQDNKKVVELEKVFSTFDKNGDGFITMEELQEFLMNIGLFSSDKDVVNMIEKLDMNGDGLIDLEEFCKMYGSLEGIKEDEEEEEVELRDAFDVFDGNRDGLITVEELSSVLATLGLKKGIRSEDCKEMIKKVDVDGDGMVNFDEFKLMMKNGANLICVS